VIQISFTATGVEEAMEEISSLIDDVQEYKRVDLKAKSRADGDASNLDIAESLVAYGRDFFSMNDAERARIVERFKIMLRKRVDDISKYIKKLQKGTRRRNASSFGAFTKEQAEAAFWKRGPMTMRQIRRSSKTRTELSRRANSAVKVAWRDMMKEACEIITTRIEKQVTAQGGKPSDLTPEYAAYKKRKFGFEIPIGLASGNLLDNLSPNVPASAMRLVKADEPMLIRMFHAYRRQAIRMAKRKMLRAVGYKKPRVRKKSVDKKNDT
jgi:hypothetical protein